MEFSTNTLFLQWKNREKKIGVLVNQENLANLNYDYRPQFYTMICSEFQPFNIQYHFVVSKKYLKHVKVYEQDDPQVVFSVLRTTDGVQGVQLLKEFILPEDIFNEDDIIDRDKQLSCRFKVIMCHEDTYILTIADEQRTQLLVMKYFWKYSDSGEELVWEQQQLNLINSTRVGFEDFRFNYYEVIPVNGEPEVHFILDDMIIILRFCTFIGHIKEVYHKNQMEKYSRLLTLNCFKDQNNGKDVNNILYESRCLISTEAGQIYHYEVKRSAVTPIYEGRPVIASYQIESITFKEKFLYPMTIGADCLTLGNRYFTASSMYSKYLMVYDFENPSYSIGSIQKPYDMGISVKFTKHGDDEYLIYKSSLDTGKVFKIGDFVLKILNDISDVEEVNLKFNENVDVFDKDIHAGYLNFSLREYKEKNNIQKNEAEDDLFYHNIWVQIWLSFLISVIGMCIVLKCVKKEKKKFRNLVQELRN